MSSINLARQRRIVVFRLITVSLALGVGGVLAWLLWLLLGWFGPMPIERANRDFSAAWETYSPVTRELLERAGYGERDRLVARANFNGALVFSGHVMEPDAARGYRFHPSQANLWCQPAGLPFQLMMPDTEEVRQALDRARVGVTMTERINSLGCRGAEIGALEDYDFRVLVLGDSFAQGILVEESQTFCVQLERRLDETGVKTLVVNSGVIGYSTEQEYFTLLELAPRVRPDAVVLCFYANDVESDHYAVMRTWRPRGDWKTAQHWINECVKLCRTRGIPFVLAAVPDRSQIASRMSRFQYQHRLEEIAGRLAFRFIDPHERFLAHRAEQLWLPGDAHFAEAGHRLFAQSLSEHLEPWVRQVARQDSPSRTPASR